MFEGFAYLLLFTLLPIAVIVGAASAISTARREGEREGAPVDDGIGTVRRLFIYVLALVGVIFAATGLSMIIGSAVDSVVGETLVQDRRSGLAVALAFTVVGTPAWLLFMLLAQRSIQSHDVERRSQARRLYFGLARSIALMLVAWNAIEVVSMILGVTTISGSAWGMVIAWGAVWAIHQCLASSEPASDVVTRLIDRLALYYGALFGLLLMITGAIWVLANPLTEAYDRAFRENLIEASSWSRSLRESAALLLVGAAIWAWHWFVQLRRRDQLTTLWRVHVFLFGALLGVTLVLVPVATILYLKLEWFLGDPRSETMAAHFSGVPTMLAMLLVGVATWGYHRAVLTEVGDDHARSGPERVYRYLLSAAGLFAAALGIATLIALAAEGISGERSNLIDEQNWWRNPLLRGVTLLVVGLPLWARYWRETQRALTAGLEERAAPSRRVYVFGTVGVSIFALLVSLTVVLYQVFQAILGADVTPALLRDARWGLAVALTSAAIAYYHFLVLREDNAIIPDEETAPKSRTRSVVLVAPGDASALIADLERIDGVRVRSWRRTDGDGATLSDDRREALRTAIAAAGDDRLLGVAARGDFELIPYAEDPR